MKNPDSQNTLSPTLPTHKVDCIGEVAGLIWHYLEEKGPVTLSKLSRAIDSPRDLVMQGVGWLAREGKVTFESGEQSKLVKLT